MKFNKIFPRTITLLAVLGLISLMSCESYMRNPLVDKDSGENIKLLIVDFNFVKTKMAVHIKDLTTEQYIEGEEVEIRFLGEDAGNLITFTGTKPDKFLTDKGFMEIGWDPNVSVSTERPIELSVYAVSQNYISAPMAISYTTEGLKDVVIKMIYTGGKSGSTSAFNEPFDLKFNNVVSSSDLSFVADASALPTGSGYDYMNMYTTLVQGQLVSENLTDPIIYSDYGVYYLNAPANLTPPSAPTKDVNLQASSTVYSSVLRTGVEKCSQGLTLRINRTDGGAGSGSFGFLITFSDGTTKDGIISGVFPIEVLIDNIYYPASDPSVTVKIFDDAQYDISEAQTIATACGASANFNASIKAGLDTYKLIVRYSCANAAASVALSIGGEFRKAGSLGGWTRFQFVEGITNLQLLAGDDYDFRIIIDSDSYEYVLPTDPNTLEQFFLDNQSSDFYTIETLTLTQTDGLVEIEADIELAGEVCDIIN